jgi:hypothetical protein
VTGRRIVKGSFEIFSPIFREIEKKTTKIDKNFRILANLTSKIFENFQNFVKNRPKLSLLSPYGFKVLSDFQGILLFLKFLGHLLHSFE